MEERICALAREGVSPLTLAHRFDQDINAVYELLARKGIDWAQARRPGRPVQQLYLGQEVFVERAWNTPLTQSAIAKRTGLSVERMKRYIQAKAEPVGRRSTDIDKRRHRLLRAISRYIRGDAVLVVCKEEEVRPPVLYRALRERGVPLRVPQRKEFRNVGDNTTHPEENGDRPS